MNKLLSLPLAFVCGLLFAPVSAESVTLGSSSTLPPPMITNPESPTGTVGVAYSPFQFTASGGAAPLTWSEKPQLTMGLSLSPAGVLSGTPTSDGEFPITLKVTDALNRSASVLTIIRVSIPRPASTFTKTGSLGIPRAGHAATLLLTGEVLVTGGGHGGPDVTAELYDPARGSFSPTGNMTEARSGHTATLLSNANPPNHGKVLIVGSVGTSAELYDPARRTFAATRSMHHARTSPTATLLFTGKVLIVGGNTKPGDLKAELYDPAAGTFSDTGSTTILRTGHTATLLGDGRVLIAGGTGAAGATAEVYEATSGSFTPTAFHMTEPRSGHTATLLATQNESDEGSVLIIGTDGSADLYSPFFETFTRVGSLLTRPSYRHTASLINDRGAVLVAGGYALHSANPACNPHLRFPVSEGSAALFAPESEGFTATGHLNTSRDGHTATVLSDGITVLVIGGTERGWQFHAPNFCNAVIDVLSSAELFMGPQDKNFTVLHSFTGPPKDGAMPFNSGTLVQDSAGNLYGTAFEGGASNNGVVFKLDGTTHAETVLHSFAGPPTDGAGPAAAVIRDGAGNLYGTTVHGGTSDNGVVFKVEPTGKEVVLHSFTGGADGAGPQAGLVRDAAGNLYGTSAGGGVFGQGVVFKVDPTGKETVLHSFGFGDGASPYGRLIRDQAGNLYGTTAFGGGFGQGVVFKVDPSGKETALWAFTGGADGASPQAGLIRDSEGNLYGTTAYGGDLGCGVVFKLDSAGKESVLHTFTCGADGSQPRSVLARDSLGNLYGTTEIGGTFEFGVVFKLDRTGKETVLHTFGGLDDGYQLDAGLLLDAAGNLYGTTVNSGASGFGVVFKINLW